MPVRQEGATCRLIHQHLLPFITVRNAKGKLDIEIVREQTEMFNREWYQRYALARVNREQLKEQFKKGRFKDSCSQCTV